MSGNSVAVPPLPPGSVRGVQPPPIPPPPQLQPRNPRVSAPTISPGLPKPPDTTDLTIFGAKTRFVASSPNRVGQPESSPRFRGIESNGIGLANGSSPGPPMNGLGGSLIRRSGGLTPRKKQRPIHFPVEASSRGQTPDWIRDIFTDAKRGDAEKLVKPV